MQSNIKYRPADFDEIIGNKIVVNSLNSFFESKNIPHAFLFVGSAGCGKTTFARIICNKLKCEDIIEINSSNNRGIDTARDIIKNAYLKPMQGKVKVYIFDEVHKATNDFQNAILKLVEEPPEHVYFILCTTDPSKLIKALVSRCTTYEVNILSDMKMTRLLQNVAGKMKVKLSEKVSKMIVQKAQGVPRDALVMLDQVINIKDTEQQVAAVNKLKLEESSVIDLCRALMEGKKWSILAGILQKIEGDPEQIRRAVLGYASKVLLNKSNDQAAFIIEAFRNNFYDTGFAGLVSACYAVAILKS